MVLSVLLTLTEVTILPLTRVLGVRRYTDIPQPNYPLLR